MKLNGPLIGNYDLDTQTLRIEGHTEIGETAVVELPVNEEDIFIGWLISVIHETHWARKKSVKALIVDKIDFNVFRNREGAHDASFTFHVGKFRLTYYLPAMHDTPDRLYAAKSHIEQALDEILTSSPPERQ